jgi:hypothetical protein
MKAIKFTIFLCIFFLSSASYAVRIFTVNKEWVVDVGQKKYVCIDPAYSFPSVVDSGITFTKKEQRYGSNFDVTWSENQFLTAKSIGSFLKSKRRILDFDVEVYAPDPVYGIDLLTMAINIEGGQVVAYMLSADENALYAYAERFLSGGFCSKEVNKKLEQSKRDQLKWKVDAGMPQNKDQWGRSH